MEQRKSNKKNDIKTNENVEVPNTENKPVLSKYYWIILIAIIAVTALVYSPISKNDFLNWDDDMYVIENTSITNFSAQNIKTWFTQTYFNNYNPLTTLTYAIDYQIGGFNPKVYTLTNLVIHIFNIILVFIFILLLFKVIKENNNKIESDSKNPYIVASITAILFAIHPFNVESVAWISERKNVLFAFFFLLSLISYLMYINQNKNIFYIISILFFVFSLLSKGVAVSLSLSVVAIDYVLQRKLLSRKVIFEKIPFFLLSIIFGIVAILAQGKENVGIKHPFYEQPAFASYGFVNYLLKLIIPSNLSGFYSYPQEATIIHWISFIVTIAILVVLFIYRKRMTKLITFAILFYISNIVLLIQLIPVGDALMADRYIYISSIGFFLIIAIMATKIAPKFSSIYLFLAIAFVFYGFTAFERVKVWNNSLLFWNKVIEKDKTIPTAWLNRGFAKGNLKDYPGAFDDFNKAINLKPDFQEAYYNRGIIKVESGDFDGGINDFNTAIKIMPTYTNAYCFRGNVKREMGDNIGALEDFNKAIMIKPKFKEAYNNRGIVYSNLGKIDEALSDFSKAVELDPKYADSYYNRGKFRKIIKDYPLALEDLNKAIILNPQFFNAYTLRAKVKMKLGDIQGAINDCKSVIQMDSSMTTAYITLSAALYKSGKYNEAINNINVVLENAPQSGISFYIRGLCNTKMKNTKDGNNDLLTAQKLGFVAKDNEIAADLE